MSPKTLPSDIEIAQKAKLLPIEKVASKLDLGKDEYEPYGHHIAKVRLSAIEKRKNKPDGNLILVTAMTPTPMGEGKTLTTIGLAQALTKLGLKTLVAIREPSMGPVFGIKGGAAGGGNSQVVPMENINLHFTGDLHALTSATNLLAALIDNHIHFGNALDIDLKYVLWNRAMDMNERALRNVVVALGGTTNGVPRADAFDITVASETMAIFCLASDVPDLKKRLGNILVAYNRKGEPVTADKLKGHGAMAVLLRDALQPNLVQTLEGVPAFVHGGPFANIAHGCNSLIATRLALKTADYVVTEAGFGADLGAEKFFDIKCRAGNLKPRATVLVATMRALRWHGGAARDEVLKPNLDAVKRGIVNLEKHIENIGKFGVPCVVALNRFTQDTDEEIKWVLSHVKGLGAEIALSEVWEKGGEGGLDLGRSVMEATKKKSKFSPIYDVKESIPDKINKIATAIYGASGVEISPAAKKMIARLESFGLDKLPVCMAKTQYSLTDNPKVLGRPTDFTIQVPRIRPSAGAGFLVALTGEIMTMPGLPRVPCAEAIDLDDKGRIKGLF